MKYAPISIKNAAQCAKSAGKPGAKHVQKILGRPPSPVQNLCACVEPNFPADWTQSAAFLKDMGVYFTDDGSSSFLFLIFTVWAMLNIYFVYTAGLPSGWPRPTATWAKRRRHTSQNR
jgi:hypothetical protein